ncbi:signal peptide peptidase SppA [Candidatus Williamhamiltonella defendens]|uniref:signal peptide peptidase SppA n=1 Tax=Candidatus Williamhamiltonella defendens TaxID=138072 RepID=UPI00130E47CD|nr:signal peptide peptidase SppA [Candidatus Hamiltonella defensa]
MRTVWQFMGGFVRWIWRSINFMRVLVLNLCFLLLIIIGVMTYLHFQNGPLEPVKGALLVDLRGIVQDKPATNTLFRQWSKKLLEREQNKLQENSLFDIVEIVRQAKIDNNINGLVLSLSHLIAIDQPSLQYIGKALREFRETGKPIYAIGDSYTQEQYYLASFANKIYLSPQGTVDIHGFATHQLYYKSLIDKLKINSHIFRVGTYKSAVEPFMRNDMSPDVREADQRWIHQLWRNYLEVVAKNRHLTAEQFFPAIPELLSRLDANDGNTAQYALNNKWVDQLASRSEVEKEFVRIFGWDQKNEDFNFISIYEYNLKLKIDPKKNDHHIAVIFVNGMITDGLKTPNNVGAEDTAYEIRQARLNPKIKAVILRVNSPGGSVSASELIRSELATLHEAKKPLVVSMGGLGASGGYWISTPSDCIIASPSTLTGSIGIFGVINTFENSLKSIGVSTDGVGTSPLSNISITKNLSPEFSKIMQMNVENGYKIFVKLVAAARHQDSKQIDSIAQGRVWTGFDAKNNGLIDQLGDFDDAVEKAAELANLKNYQLYQFGDQLNFRDILFDQINAALPFAFEMQSPLSDIVSIFNRHSPNFVQSLQDPLNRYAICLNCREVN